MPDAKPASWSAIQSFAVAPSALTLDSESGEIVFPQDMSREHSYLVNVGAASYSYKPRPTRNQEKIGGDSTRGESAKVIAEMRFALAQEHQQKLELLDKMIQMANSFQQSSMQNIEMTLVLQKALSVQSPATHPLVQFGEFLYSKLGDEMKMLALHHVGMLAEPPTTPAAASPAAASPEPQTTQTAAPVVDTTIKD